MVLGSIELVNKMTTLKSKEINIIANFRCINLKGEMKRPGSRFGASGFETPKGTLQHSCIGTCGCSPESTQGHLIVHGHYKKKRETSLSEKAYSSFTELYIFKP